MSNGTATAAITIQTAPRDAESLKKVGIFQLRILTEKLLGGTMAEQDKMAYAGLNLDQKVDYALQLLQRWDQQNPGVAQAMQQQQAPVPQAPPQQMMMPAPQANGTINGAHALPSAPPPAMTSAPVTGPQIPFGNGMGMNGMGAQAVAQMQMPMQQVPMPQMGAMQVNPAQVAAASQNAQATATKERKPRNSASEKSDPDLGAEVIKLLTTINAAQTAQGEAIVGALKEVTSALDEIKKNDVKAELKGLNEAYGGVYNLLQRWDARLTQIQNASNLSISLSLFLAEQVLNTTRADILQLAAADIPSIAAMLQASQGKA